MIRPISFLFTNTTKWNEKGIQTNFKHHMLRQEYACWVFHLSFVPTNNSPLYFPLFLKILISILRTNSRTNMQTNKKISETVFLNCQRTVTLNYHYYTCMTSPIHYITSILSIGNKQTNKNVVSTTKMFLFLCCLFCPKEKKT